MIGTAYSFSPITGEAIGAVEAQCSPLEGEKLLRPANTLFKAPPAVGPRETAVFLLNYAGERNDVVTDESDWIVYPDWRGVALYKTVSGAKFLLADGDINVAPADVAATELVPGLDDTWSGTAWVLDTAKQRARLVAAAAAERDRLLVVATAAIAPLQDAVDLDMASLEEKLQLAAWKQYRVGLNRIQAQTGYPAAIDWPVAPA